MTRLLPLTLLFALACSAPAETEPLYAQAAAAGEAAGALPVEPEPAAAGGSQQTQGGAAGASALPSAGKPPTEPEPTPAAGAGGAPTVEPQPTAGAAGSSAGSAGAPSTAGGGGQPTTCTPRPWLEACGSRACGPVDDGCGSDYHCGTCTGLSECSPAGQCVETCAMQGLECGTTAAGLECGTCGDGLTCDAGKCVEPCHEEPIDTTAGKCAIPSQRIWLGCHQAPKPYCNQPTPSVWCCPG